MKKWILLILLTLISIGCFSSDNDSASNDGGSGSEIVGDVSYEDGDSLERQIVLGDPVIKGNIFIFKSSYEADTDIKPIDYTPKTTTDNYGNFSINDVALGTYIIEANDKHGKAVTRKVRVLENEKIYSADSLVVKKTSSLNFTINTSLQLDGLNVSYVVYILGTRNYSKGDETKLSFTLNDIPYGTYDVKFVLKVQGVEYTHTENDVTFLPEVAENLVVDIP